MIWRLKDLLQFDVLREVERGVWVACRPVPWPFTWRLRAAWEVLCGRADALTWPVANDPTSWCAIPSGPQSSGQPTGDSSNG